jgi:acetyl-CoA hydrolase
MSVITGALKERLGYSGYLSKVMRPEDTVKFFQDGDYIGWSGFTPVGDPKAVPVALAEYVEANGLQGKLRFNLFIGASSGQKNEDRWAKNDMIATRFPYQNSDSLRKRINSGTAKFADKHLGQFPQDLFWGWYSKPRGGGIHTAIIETSEVLADGSIVPSGAVGSSVEMVNCADKIIIELNTAIPSFKGCHDIIRPWRPPGQPFNITSPMSRIGDISIKVDPSKVVAVVESKLIFPGRAVKGADNESRRIANIIRILDHQQRFHLAEQDPSPDRKNSVNDSSPQIFRKLSEFPFSPSFTRTAPVSHTNLFHRPSPFFIPIPSSLSRCSGVLHLHAI